jgi:recombination protein RecT
MARELQMQAPQAATVAVTKSAAPEQQTIAQALEKYKDDFRAALPKHVDVDRLLRLALTVVNRTPRLLECSQKSLLGAIMTCAQLGLEPGPSGDAYLLPFKVKGQYECTFILGYRGMMELARRSGQVETIFAEPVFKGDDFRYSKGLNPELHHVPDPDGDENPADLTHVYAVVKYKGGGHRFIVMSRKQVEKYRNESKSPDGKAWMNHYVAMALKTSVRRLATWMPQSPEFITALATEGQVRTDYQNPGSLDDLAVTASQEEFMEGEVVDSVSGPPAAMNPATGEVPASDWPEVKKIPGQ